MNLPQSDIAARQADSAATRRLHIVTTVNAAWNMWNFRRQMLTALLADGHRVTVLAPSDEAVDRLVDLGCEFHPLEMDIKSLNPFAQLGLFFAMFRAFRQLRPDLVLGFTIKNNTFGSIAARLLGIPFIPNVTGLGTAFLSGKFLQRVAHLLYRVSFAGCPLVFFQNRDDSALFTGLNLVREDQVVVVPGSGIDLVHFAQAPMPAHDGPVQFLMIARLLRDKGVVEYVEAAKMVRESHPGTRFLLLGPAGSENRTAFSAEQAHEWERTHGIEYLGPSDDVRPHIEQAHCVVLPSYREGAPRTLIEAAAIGRPLIASDVPGCHDIVDDGSNGLLCTVRDAESLASAMRRFLDMEAQQWATMGQEGRDKMVREYDVAHVANAYRRAIADITGMSAITD
ncbi:glycosyltransferase family 4 protein [Aurantiacibacter gilvus]|uniref:Glycosyltransferase family 4 protein n=1 Tax=Aurantiacibacter gilvus TaxID=3139141 RepID=A0ABU9IGJ6_9SPHN